jgi:hypothetical protein
MKGNTDILLDQAEAEHGQLVGWWAWAGTDDDDMFAPYDDLEWEILCPEPIKPSKCALFTPPGTIIWMECNHPGRVYISDRDNYEWSNYNGYSPYEITWDAALDLITSGEDGEPWNLEVCGPLPEGCKAEMENRVCGREP